MAEILTKKLPKVYHQLFLPNIEIYNLTPQKSMQNLKTLLSALKTVFDSQREAPCIEEFTAEGLYFDHNMMEIFVYSVIIPL